MGDSTMTWLLIFTALANGLVLYFNLRVNLALRKLREAERNEAKAWAEVRRVLDQEVMPRVNGEQADKWHTDRS